MNKLSRCIFFPFIALLLSCGGDSYSVASNDGGISGTGNGGSKASLAGSAYKGPFIQDSAINVFKIEGDTSSEISNSLVQENLGNFTLQTDPGLLSVRATGRFYDETTATYSDDTVTLSALVNVTAGQQARLYINVLTHMSHDYAVELINQGNSYEQAMQQAERRVKELLATVTGEVSVTQPFINMNLSNTPGTVPEDNAYVLYVSSLFSEAVDERSIESPGYTMSTLLNTLKADVFNDSAIDEETLASLQEANGRLDATSIQQNLEAVLLGETIAPVNDVIEEVSPGLVAPSNLTTYTDTVNSKQRFCFDMLASCSDSGHKAEIIVPTGYSYEYQIDDNADFSSPSESSTWGRNFYEIDTVGLASGTWYFRVRKIHESGQLSTWADVDFVLP